MGKKQKTVSGRLFFYFARRQPIIFYNFFLGRNACIL